MMQNKAAFQKRVPNKVVEMFDSGWIILQIFEEKVGIISFLQQRTKGIEYRVKKAIKYSIFKSLIPEMIMEDLEIDDKKKVSRSIEATHFA